MEVQEKTTLINMDKAEIVSRTEILIECVSKSSATISNKEVKVLAEKWVADNYSDLCNIFDKKLPEKKILEYLYKTVHNERLVKSRWLKSLRKIFKNLKRSDYSVSDQIIYFDPQKPFTAYQILKNLFSKAKSRISIYDGYVEEGTLDVLSGALKGTEISILTNNTYGKFARELAKFKIEFVNCKARKSSFVHDRFFFIDDKCFIVGTSLHSLGKNKASHVFSIPQKVGQILQSHFDDVWKRAEVL